MLYDGWHPLVRIMVVGTCAYVALIVLLRSFGKRTLSQFNAFDFVVTVALGSTLATVLLSKETALAEGVLAFGLLMSLQFVVTLASRHSRVIDGLVKADPALLYYGGGFVEGALRRERVTVGEVRSAVREQGIASMGEVEAIVLETSGRISVLRVGEGRASVLTGVDGWPPES